MSLNMKSDSIFKIKRLLENYPTVDKMKSLKSFHGSIYVCVAFASILFANCSLFGFDINANFLDASGVTWWHYLLSLLGIVMMFFFGSKALGIPKDLDCGLQFDELKNVFVVAEYNPSVKAYIEANKNLTKRDYYYLNVYEQLNIITNIEGMSALEEALLKEPKVASPTLKKMLSGFQDVAFVSKKQIATSVSRYKKKAFGALFLFIGIVTVAATVNVDFTPQIRAFVILACLFLFISMLYFVSQLFSISEAEETTIDAETYRNMGELCAYSPNVHTYIKSVIEEGRYLNRRDISALSVEHQVEGLRCANFMEGQLSRI